MPARNCIITYEMKHRDGATSTGAIPAVSRRGGALHVPTGPEDPVLVPPTSPDVSYHMCQLSTTVFVINYRSPYI